MSNPVLPAHVYDTLVEVCKRHPGPVQDTRLLGDILNEVAWRHRDEGFGLSRKTGGTRVDSPVGDIAEDVLQRKDGHHWDVLTGAGRGQPLRPSRGPSIGIIDMRSRPWVAPVEPEYRDSNPAPQPPAPSPTPTPQPPPQGGASNEAVLQSLEEVKQLLRDVRADIDGARNRIIGELHALMGQEVIPHIDDLKRVTLGLPRDPRFQ